MKPYLEQVEKWPQTGQHILAQYSDESIVVYQAYKKEIGEFAIKNQFFGGEFSFTRMSWIKPNFLWMMYRSGWGQKPGQETTLAIKLKMEYFESILENSVISRFDSSLYKTQNEWKDATKASNVRLQWDPDHNPLGQKEARRAIQLGLRNELLEPFRGDGIIVIEDISEFVAEQREFALNSQFDKLLTPAESVFIPNDRHVGLKVGIEQ